MKNNILSILFITVSAIAKAFADTLDHHFDTSIFKHWSRVYFDPNIIHKTGLQIFGYPVDGWHIANSIMIFAFLAVPLVYKPKYKWWIDYLIGGTIFILVFNLFYNFIFK